MNVTEGILWLIKLMFSGCRYGNKILVTDELPDGQMVDQWEPVTCDFVKTPLEVQLTESCVSAFYSCAM